jgi:hypothetical protein
MDEEEEVEPHAFEVAHRVIPAGEPLQFAQGMLDFVRLQHDERIEWNPTEVSLLMDWFLGLAQKGPKV